MNGDFFGRSAEPGFNRPEAVLSGTAREPAAIYDLAARWNPNRPRGYLVRLFQAGMLNAELRSVVWRALVDEGECDVVADAETLEGRPAAAVVIVEGVNRTTLMVSPLDGQPIGWRDELLESDTDHGLSAGTVPSDVAMRVTTVADVDIVPI